MAKVLHKEVVFSVSLDNYHPQHKAQLRIEARFRSGWVDEDIIDAAQIEACMTTRDSMSACFSSVEEAYSWQIAIGKAFRCMLNLEALTANETPPANEPSPPANEPSPPATDAPATT